MSRMGILDPGAPEGIPGPAAWQVEGLQPSETVGAIAIRRRRRRLLSWQSFSLGTGDCRLEI